MPATLTHAARSLVQQRKVKAD